MKKKRTIQIGCLAISVSIAMVAFYCYGPALPGVRRHMHRHIVVWWSFYRGWFAASRDRVHGKLGYSFDRYFVDGIAAYARAADGIAPCEPPENVEWFHRYREGFNRRMEGPIRKKVGSAFPDGYVRRYLQNGWIDLSVEQPSTCPVHHRAMAVAVIPIEIVFPVTIPHSKFEEETTAEEFFPFAGSTWKVDASLMPRPKNVRVRVCPECAGAERVWLKSHQKPNQSLEPTTLLGTSAAEQPLVPSRVVAHL